jgi:hypothetical protein
MFLGRLAGVQVQGEDLLTDQKAGPLVKTHHRVRGITGQCIEPEQALPGGYETAVDFPNAPRLLKMRLEAVFLSILPTWLCETAST